MGVVVQNKVARVVMAHTVVADRIITTFLITGGLA